MFIFSKNTRCRFFFLCILAILYFYQTDAAQSGRRPTKKPAAIERTAPSSETLQTNAGTESAEIGAPERISSLLVVGKVQHDFSYYKSNDADNALKEFIRFLKFTSRTTAQVVRGGNLSYAEAREQAKNEADAYTLWLGFSAKEDGYGNIYIDSVQYAVIKPKTAKILTRGEVKPGENQIGNSGGVLRSPTARRSPTRALSEMKNAARQIAAILARGGWLD
jgi:hypothetical protein